MFSIWERKRRDLEGKLIDDKKESPSNLFLLLQEIEGCSQLQSQKATLTSFVFAQSFGSRFRRRAFLVAVDVFDGCQAAMESSQSSNAVTSRMGESSKFFRAGVLGGWGEQKHT